MTEFPKRIEIRVRGREELVESRLAQTEYQAWRHGFRNRWKRGVLVRGISVLDYAEAIVGVPAAPPTAPPDHTLRIVDASGWASPDRLFSLDFSPSLVARRRKCLKMRGLRTRAPQACSQPVEDARPSGTQQIQAFPAS